MLIIVIRYPFISGKESGLLKQEKEMRWNEMGWIRLWESNRRRRKLSFYSLSQAYNFSLFGSTSLSSALYLWLTFGQRQQQEALDLFAVKRDWVEEFYSKSTSDHQLLSRSLSHLLIFSSSHPCQRLCIVGWCNWERERERAKVMKGRQEISWLRQRRDYDRVSQTQPRCWLTLRSFNPLTQTTSQWWLSFTNTTVNVLVAVVVVVVVVVEVVV